MSGNPGGPSSVLAHLPYCTDENGDITFEALEAAKDLATAAIKNSKIAKPLFFTTPAPELKS